MSFTSPNAIPVRDAEAVMAGINRQPGGAWTCTRFLNMCTP